MNFAQFFRRLLMLSCVAILFYASYGASNWMASQRVAVPEIVFEWETSLPFYHWSILPYWSLNLLYAVGFFIVNKQKVLHYTIQLLVAQIIAVVCFLLFPLTFTWVKPETQGFYGWLFQSLESFDKPFNQAPSLHIILCVIVGSLYMSAPTIGGWIIAIIAVATAFIAGISQGVFVLLVCAILLYYKKQHWLIAGWFGLIGLSVLTTWQHHFIDIPTGIIVGLLVLVAVPLFGDYWRYRQPDKGRLKWGGFYAMIATLACIVAIWLGDVWLWLLYFSVSFGLLALGYTCFGQCVFRKNQQGKMALPSKILLLPYLWIARLNARIWLKSKSYSDEILPNIFLGSVLDCGKFDVVFDLTTEFELPLNHDQVSESFPMLDMVLPSESELCSAAYKLNELIHRTQHKKLLVCCALGYSRSAAVFATWLVLYRRFSLEHACSFICQKRSNIQLNKAWQIRINDAITG